MNFIAPNFRLACLLSLFAVLTACGNAGDEHSGMNHDTMAQDSADSMDAEMAQGFVKAEPAVNEVLARPPRTLRVYFTATPDVPNSYLKLFGEQGEIALSRFHTMGADDLMIEIDDHPLPNGKYRVEWMAMLGEEKSHHMGDYEFTVAVEE